MKNLLFLSMFCLIFCFPVLAQNDVDEAMPHYAVLGVDTVLLILPNCHVIYVGVDPDIDGTDIWTPFPTDGDKVTLPPNCGYEGVTSPPTQNGCEYVTFSGTDKDNNEFSITAQVYIYKNTPTGEKAKEISDELNNQSDNTANDPIVSSAAKGKFTIQPAAGSEITSAEWDNGSGEEDNELNELSCEKKQTSAIRMKGILTGLNSNGEPSSIMVGFGQFKIRTYLEANENHAVAMARLKYGLTFLGIKAKLGFDSEGVCWLVWDNPYRKARFGSNDTGISHMIVSDRLAPSLTDQLQSVKVGRYDISF